MTAAIIERGRDVQNRTKVPEKKKGVSIATPYVEC